MVTPSNTQELRQFLDQCVNETKPVSYTDRGGHTHLVFVTKVDEVTVRTKAGRDEAALALTMIETTPETLELATHGSSRDQEQFLLRCVDSTAPIEYQDCQNRKHRVFLTRMTLGKRVARTSPDEWQYQLTMVDAWGGVWVYAIAGIKISITTKVTVKTHVTDVIGTPNSIGLAQIGR